MQKAIDLQLHYVVDQPKVGEWLNREFANSVFHVRIYFPLRYTSLISVCDVIS